MVFKIILFCRIILAENNSNVTFQLPVSTRSRERIGSLYGRWQRSKLQYSKWLDTGQRVYSRREWWPNWSISVCTTLMDSIGCLFCDLSHFFKTYLELGQTVCNVLYLFVLHRWCWTGRARTQTMIRTLGGRLISIRCFKSLL